MHPEPRRVPSRLGTLLRSLLVLVLAGALVGVGTSPDPAPHDGLAPIKRALPDADFLPVSRPQPPEPAPEPAPAPQQPPGTPSQQAFAGRYPEHAAAQQIDGQPSTFHWAVIVGVNDYQGRTGSTLGSVADAHVLRDSLFRRGWRGDHVLVLTDGAATRDWMVRALEWLVAKTDERSTVVFSFSGHMRHSGGNSALWPADNAYLWNADFGRMIGAVRADRMWVSLQGCHAEGMRAAGVEGPNRVVTYSSRTPEKSFEDPEAGHSVQGNYLLREGLLDGWGNNGQPTGVSVQGAFAWAAPRANIRTAGKQTPVLADHLGRPFTLEITGPPAG
ncbi:MAG TPA: caspase family protein [Egibacteraceae bacterium]|nr:caspase family protein [Egibacteraceae bacterium]